MKRNIAKRIVTNALTSYIEDCSGVGSPETRQIEKAWEVLSNPPCYYQVRQKCSGEWKFLIVDFEDDEFAYDPQDLESARESAKLCKGYVVKITEEKL